MILTFFYMVATWIQGWRLSSLKARLSVALQGVESKKPSIMFYTAAVIRSKEGTDLIKSQKFD